MEIQLLNQTADFGWDVCGYKGEGSVEGEERVRAARETLKVLGPGVTACPFWDLETFHQCPDHISPSALPGHFISCSLTSPCLHLGVVKYFFFFLFSLFICL